MKKDRPTKKSIKKLSRKDSEFFKLRVTRSPIFLIPVFLLVIFWYLYRDAYAAYSNEMQTAYQYAYSIGITTKSPIDKADMYGNLLRSHMAKMMVNFAKYVGGKSPDYTLPCKFTDIDYEKPELKGYIIEACQMRLMGVGTSLFHPKSLVTRAEFGTILSRAIFSSLYDGGTPYYVKHLEALQKLGIMTKTTKTSAPEIRGNVMLMLQRASMIMSAYGYGYGYGYGYWTSTID